MEFAGLRRPATAAADGVETGRLRRFADLPPPSQGNANASLVDAALVRRREELLWELNKARILQDTILLELIETEHAMGFTAAVHNPVPTFPSSRDYLRFRTPTVPPLEEAPLHPQCSSIEHPPCGSRGPEHPRLGNGAEQQQECRSREGGNVFNGYAELYPPPSKRALVEGTLVPVVTKAEAAASGHRWAFGGEPMVDVEGSLGVQPFGEIRNCSGQRKGVESAMEDRSDKPTQLPGQHRLAGLENATYNEQKVEFGESAHERTSAGVKRNLSVATSPAKKLKPLGEYESAICHVNMPTLHHLEEHVGGNLHQSKLTTVLQSPRSGGAEPNPGATPVWKRLTVANTESLRQDVKENAMESSGSQQPHSFPHRKGPDAAKKAFYCKVCDLQCNSEKMLADHLGGRKHREKLEENPFYCKVCGVLCNSLKSLADHLRGRRHRETLEGSESDSD